MMRGAFEVVSRIIQAGVESKVPLVHGELDEAPIFCYCDNRPVSYGKESEYYFFARTKPCPEDPIVIDGSVYMNCAEDCPCTQYVESGDHKYVVCENLFCCNVTSTYHLVASESDVAGLAEHINSDLPIFCSPLCAQQMLVVHTSGFDRVKATGFLTCATFDDMRRVLCDDFYLTVGGTILDFSGPTTLAELAMRKFIVDSGLQKEMADAFSVLHADKNAFTFVDVAIRMITTTGRLRFLFEYFRRTPIQVHRRVGVQTVSLADFFQQFPIVGTNGVKPAIDSRQDECWITEEGRIYKCDPENYKSYDCLPSACRFEFAPTTASFEGRKNRQWQFRHYFIQGENWFDWQDVGRQNVLANSVVSIMDTLEELFYQVEAAGLCLTDHRLENFLFRINDGHIVDVRFSPLVRFQHDEGTNWKQVTMTRLKDMLIRSDKINWDRHADALNAVSDFELCSRKRKRN